MTKSKPSKKSSARRIGQSLSVNNYNIFYILERELLLKQNGCTPKEKLSSEYEKRNYGDLASSFPARPSRYESLDLPDTWYLKRSARSRDRSKKNRSISQKGLSTTIALNWKSCDAEVKSYVTTIAKIIKKRHDEIQSSESGKKSPAYSPSSDDSSPKFGPQVSVNLKKAVELKKDARRVSMSSSASSHGAFLQKEHIHQVPNSWMPQKIQGMSSIASSHGAFLQKDWVPDTWMPQMMQMQMQMQQHYQDKMINGMLNHIKAGMNDTALHLFSPSYETTHIHALQQNMKPAALYENTFCQSVNKSEGASGNMKSAGQYENIFCQSVQESASVGACQNKPNEISQTDWKEMFAGAREWAVQFLEAFDQNERNTSSAKEARACQSVTKREDGGHSRMERYGQYEIAIDRAEHHYSIDSNKCGWEQGLENLIDDASVSSDCANKKIGLVDMPDDDIREFFRVA
eukprot:scaffold138000_cov60-Cyclotella_meneghiniana.AAC.2